MPSEEMTLDDRLVEQMSFPERVPELGQGYGAIMLNEVCVTHNVSEAGIKEVTQRIPEFIKKSMIQKIHIINFNACQDTFEKLIDGILRHVSSINSIKHLKFSKIRGMKGISPKVIKRLAINCKKLKSLEIDGFEDMEDRPRD